MLIYLNLLKHLKYLKFINKFFKILKNHLFLQTFFKLKKRVFFYYVLNYIIFCLNKYK